MLRVASNFLITLAGGTKLTCAQAVETLLTDKRQLGGPLGRPGLQRPALVCLGVAGYRLPASSPADPPPPARPASWPSTTATCPTGSS